MIFMAQKRQGHKAPPQLPKDSNHHLLRFGLLADFLGVRESREGFSVLQMERQTQRGRTYQLAGIRFGPHSPIQGERGR